jgi:hypothetical protein
MLKKMQVQNICTALEYSLPLFFNLKWQLLHVPISDEVICSEVSW